MIRIAANLGMLFTERPLLARFAAAADAGFAAVELLMPYEVAPGVVRAEIDRLGLMMLGLNTATGRPGEMGLAAVPGREADFASAFAQALDYARIVGALQIHCVAGLVPADQRPAAEATFVRNIVRAADLAAPHGITILIEPINTRDRPNFYLTRIEQAAGLVGRMGRDNVRIQFDCYHAQIMGGDLIKRFEAHAALVGHVQIAGVPDRSEPDEGEVNYPAVLAAFDRLGYSGWVSAEYRPKGRTEDGLGWAASYGIGRGARGWSAG